MISTQIFGLICYETMNVPIYKVKFPIIIDVDNQTPKFSAMEDNLKMLENSSNNNTKIVR